MGRHGGGRQGPRGGGGHVSTTSTRSPSPLVDALLDRFGWLKMASASEWAVFIATSVLCAGAYARHGLPLATLYFLATAALCAVDPSLHSLQLLNLAAVVYDLSFELHRLYMLVSNRPLLMVAIMIVALAVEWLLERYEAEDSNDERPRGALGGIARLGRSVGRMLLPAVMGVLIACVGWLVLTAALLHPSSFSAPLVEAVEQMLGSRYACVSPSDCIFVTGSHFQSRVHGVYVLSPRHCMPALARSRAGYHLLQVLLVAVNQREGHLRARPDRRVMAPRVFSLTKLPPQVGGAPLHAALPHRAATPCIAPLFRPRAMPWHAEPLR